MSRPYIYYMKILANARIHTLHPARPEAAVLVLDGSRVAAAGGDELRAEFAGAEEQDMGGRAILPGLTDAHLHLQEYALHL